jgi:hypothetical protein
VAQFIDFRIGAPQNYIYAFVGHDREVMGGPTNRGREWYIFNG